MHIGQKIKALRNVRGYNQKYMAQQLGISEKQYGNIENGVVKNMDESRLNKIAAILEVTTLVLTNNIVLLIDFDKGVIQPADSLVDTHAIQKLEKELEVARREVSHYKQQLDKAYDLLYMTNTPPHEMMLK